MITMQTSECVVLVDVDPEAGGEGGECQQLTEEQGGDLHGPSQHSALSTDSLDTVLRCFVLSPAAAFQFTILLSPGGEYQWCESSRCHTAWASHRPTPTLNQSIVGETTTYQQALRRRIINLCFYSMYVVKNYFG